jgi:hypothetical protein
MWGALSDERTGLSFTIASDPRQRSHFRVPVPRYFAVSDSSLPFSSPPMTRWATVEVFEPASTRDLINPTNRFQLYRCGTDSMENMSIAQQRMYFCCHARLSRKVFTAGCIATSTAPFHEDTVVVWTCLLSRCLEMDVLLLLRANCGNMFIQPLTSNALKKSVTVC